MKRICFKYLLLNWLWTQFLFISLINAQLDEDTWMDPDAWARDGFVNGDLQTIDGRCCKCTDGIMDHLKSQQPMRESRETDAEDSASVTYFKKFVLMLFNRNSFKYDSEQQHYKRSVVFTINTNQMDKLEQLQDPRDLDIILIDVFKNMISMNCDGYQESNSREITTIKTIVYNILYDIWQLMKTTEIRFLSVVMIIILIAWFLNSRLKIGWLLLFSGGIFVFGYLHTYLECNRELEVSQMLEILNNNADNGNNVKGFTFLTFSKQMFSKEDTNTLQQQKLKQSAKLSLRFCRPDHVLLMYFNELFVKYLHALIEQCSVAVSSLNNSLGFPYYFLTPVIMVCLLGYILKLIFKYILSPSAWAQLLNREKIYNHNQTYIKSPLDSENDRISGENLKLLLTAINAVPTRGAVASIQQNSNGVSGVEDIREAIESTEKESSPELDKSGTANCQNNNVLNDESLDTHLDVKIKDLSESL